MDRAKIIFIKNTLFRSFIVGCVFYVLILIITLGFWNTWACLVKSVFSVGEAEFGNTILLFFVMIKVILVFLMLVPAVALQWMAKKKIG